MNSYYNDYYQQYSFVSTICGRYFIAVYRIISSNCCTSDISDIICMKYIETVLFVLISVYILRREYSLEVSGFSQFYISNYLSSCLRKSKGRVSK